VLELFSDALTLGYADLIVGVAVVLPLADTSTRAGVQVHARVIEDAQNEFLASLGRGLQPFERRYESVPYLYLRVNLFELSDIVESRVAGALTSIEPNRNFVTHSRAANAAPLLHRSVPHIGAPPVWTKGYTGDGQTIVIVDTGVSHTHNIFNDQNTTVTNVVAGSYYSVNSQGTCNGVPATSCSGPANGDPSAGDPWADHPEGKREHGTSVAGVAAGKYVPATLGGVTSKLFGVAPGADLISIRVFSANVPTSPPSAWGAAQSDIIAALDEVYYDRRFSFEIACVNMSLGSAAKFASQALCDAAAPSLALPIENLRLVGIATIASTGDELSPTAVPLPACLSAAVPVAQSTLNDTQPSVSNCAPWVELLAPGSGIHTSTGPARDTVLEFGSSLAAPHVAGAFALLRECAPGSTVSAILDALWSTGAVVSVTPDGQARRRIQVDAALAMLCP
jgi:subtilisin family serine protease